MPPGQWTRWMKELRHLGCQCLHLGTHADKLIILGRYTANCSNFPNWELFAIVSMSDLIFSTLPHSIPLILSAEDDDWSYTSSDHSQIGQYGLVTFLATVTVGLVHLVVFIAVGLARLSVLVAVRLVVHSVVSIALGLVGCVGSVVIGGSLVDWVVGRNITVVGGI